MEILLLIYITTVVANFMAVMERLEIVNIKFIEISYIRASLIMFAPVVNLFSMYVLLCYIKYLRSTMV